tara:strand:+ start:143 stop:1351 length:1209 start_codon:yes stop_codon:yes gene_type:complete
MPLDGHIRQMTIPLEVQLEWTRSIKNQNNPLNLDDVILDKTNNIIPPRNFKGGRHLGRYLVPMTNVVFDPEDQPRDKSNDVNHIDGLAQRYEIMGYAIDAQPMMGTMANGGSFTVKGFAGFHRKHALERFGQYFYIIDIFEFDRPLDRRVARSQSNHHADLTLNQSINDYVKEIVNAYNALEITQDETGVSELAWRLAEGDKTKSQIEGSIIRKSIQQIGSVYSNFQTYSSQTGKNAGGNSLSAWLGRNNIVPQGVQFRTDQQLINQGYISYCAAEGDNKATWGRAIYHGQRLGIPVWVFGYASTRQSDLANFRENYIKDFTKFKEGQIDFAFGITQSSQGDGIDESNFWCKLAGFLPQHISPDSTNGGRPTEVGLVNENGNQIDFDPTSKCITYGLYDVIN